MLIHKAHQKRVFKKVVGHQSHMKIDDKNYCFAKFASGEEQFLTLALRSTPVPSTPGRLKLRLVT